MQPKEKMLLDRANVKAESKEKQSPEVSPADQWDQVAFKLIKDELAPKGFSEIKRGVWRGKVQSNIPFLPKQSVLYCQRTAAQLVRTFRSKVLKGLKERLATCEKEQETSAWIRENSFFWEFGKKRRERKAYRHNRDQEGLLRILINEIENIGIK